MYNYNKRTKKNQLHRQHKLNFCEIIDFVLFGEKEEILLHKKSGNIYIQQR